jgi:hypothetical protein
MAWVTSTWINLDPTNQQLPNIKRSDSTVYVQDLIATSNSKEYEEGDKK